MTEIIAACEINWRTLDEAKEMIRQSKIAGASHAKFQLYSENEIKDDPPLIREHERKIMLTKEDAKELFDYGKEIGQSVFFTPMFLEAVDWLEEIGATELIKIRYSDRYNYRIIEKALKASKKVIMSIDKSYRISQDVIKPNILKIGFLWCVDKYPAVDDDYSFKCIDFDFFAGISDHTKGLTIVKRGIRCRAKVIEKHVMLEKSSPIEEQWSCTFEELTSLRRFSKL